MRFAVLPGAMPVKQAIGLAIVVLCALAFNPITAYLVPRATFQNFKMDGFSMAPTLEDGELMAVRRSGGLLPTGSPSRADIVVLTDPRHADQDLVKRVIGLPGETIEVADGKVLINNTALTEPYITTAWHDKMPKLTIPADEYFVMGDNRDNSLDSRAIGPIAKELIVGRVALSYWPSDTAGFVSGVDPLVLGVIVFFAISLMAAIGMLIAAWFILTRRRRSRWWTLLAWPLGGIGLLGIFVWVRSARAGRAPTLRT